MQLHLPQGVPGWTVFATGLLVIAYRIRGIDSPRQWIEWLERQFTYGTTLRVLGAACVIVALALGYFVRPDTTTVGVLYGVSLGVVTLAGVLLVAAQNHMRLLHVATAETSDKILRVTSSLIVLAALAWALAPFVV